MYPALLLSLLVLLSSCFKTAEEIKREQLIDQQLSQSSKIIADLSGQINELKGGLANTSGQIEELGYHSKQKSEIQVSSFNQSLTQLAEQVKILTGENKKTQSEVNQLSRELKEQKAFIQKVTGTLSKMSGKPTTQTSSNLLKKAHTAFEKNQQTEAKDLYLQVISENKISNAKKNHVYYNLGLLEYWSKSYDEALVYFSKIYTKYPKSSFAPGSLLYIGRSFAKSNRPDEAKATFQEVIKNYPKSKQAKSAKEEL